MTPVTVQCTCIVVHDSIERTTLKHGEHHGNIHTYIYTCKHMYTHTHTHTCMHAHTITLDEEGGGGPGCFFDVFFLKRENVGLLSSLG